jgi:hypothetical protein
MKSLSPITLGLLAWLLGFDAGCLAEEATLVSPVVTWQGSAQRNLPAVGPHEIKVLSNAKRPSRNRSSQVAGLEFTLSA